MIFNLYSIHDRLAGHYMSIFLARSAVEAIRQVKGSLKDPQLAGSSLVTNPGDFDLFEIGQFDDATGIVNSNLTLAINVAKLVSTPGGPHDLG